MNDTLLRVRIRRNEKMSIYEFGPFRLDSGERLLLLEGKPIPLTAKVFDILDLLVRNSGHLVEKSEIMKTVWPNSIVEDNNLTVNISIIRKALGEQQYIETIPTRGYRFVGDIRKLKDEEQNPSEILQYKTENIGRSLAVLPFEVLGKWMDQGYLGLGMADALTTKLSDVPHIVVLPTRAIMKYASTGLDPITIGRELQVDSVLDGHIQKVGENIRVTVQLTSTQNGRLLWAGKFDEKLINIFAAQDSISEQVLRVLLPTALVDTLKPLTKRYTESLEAFRIYSKGRYFWNKRSNEGLEKAIEYFNRAIEIDPNYALAYTGLADAYALLSDYNFCEPHKAMPKAKAAAIKAIGIDNSLVEAHASLGFINLVYGWDWSGAEREFKRAIELNPNYVTAHHWYATYLRCMGRFDEALEELRRAQALEPTSLAINIAIGSCLYLARHYDQAIAQCKETLEFDPNNALVYLRLGSSYTQKGMYEEAIAAHERSLELVGHSQGLAMLAYTCAMSGKREKARKILEDLKEASTHEYIDPASLAVICVGLDDKDQAIKWLERAYEYRSDSLIYLNVDPELDSLRSDPRFQDLLRRVYRIDATKTRHEIINSLAVLPLDNTNNDPDVEYLSYGISESIINILAQLPQLKVISPSIVFRYKGSGTDPLDLGHRLGVSTMLGGKLLKLDGTLIIKMELVSVSDGSQIWGEQYNRPLTDLLIVQEEIARDVSEKLRLRLTREEEERISKRYTDNIEAYHLYLKGRYFWSKYTVQEVKKGLDYFHQAIKIDPDYALAYVGLADSYQRLSTFIYPPKEAMPKALASALRALEIDDTLAEAHLALGYVKMYYHHDWEGAETELKKALYLMPRSPLTHQRYASFLMYMGRLNEALVENRIAQELDPLSLPINSNIGTNLYLLRRFDEAISQLKKTLELEPRHFQSHTNLGMAYVHKGDFSMGVAQLEKAKMIDNNPVLLGLLGYAYGAAGRNSEAREVLEELKNRAEREYVSSFSMALIYIGLDEMQEAFRWLEKTYEEKNDWLLWMRIGLELDRLRPDHRFKKLLRDIGFRPEH